MARRAFVFLATAELACFVFACGSPAARAAGTVSVALRDPSTSDAVSSMSIVPRPDSAKSGRTTFTITNESKTLVHELLLFRQPNPAKLPYDAKAQRVIEDKLVKVVDTDDIQPGKSVTKTVTLKPGAYEMICNQPGHYEHGMHVDFSVHG